MDRIIKTLLKNRGITTKKQEEEFFNPQDPHKISVSELGISDSQLKKAVERIKRAIKDKEKIVVYGDYDVDGLCAAAVLWETLHMAGANALPYIPSRFAEGYGLNVQSIEKLKEEDPQLSLLITVDHGIVANEQVEFAKSLGIDVIITDHHEPGEKKPRAYAVVHTTKISGSGVAWVLARKLGSVDDHLGLVALGTITDVLPLVGPNRSVAKYGLEILRKTDRPGIRAICREAAIKQEEIDTFHINFMIGPRLNSMGRVEHALDSLRLLATRSPGKASRLAFALARTNRLRQEKTDAAVNHVDAHFAPAWSNGNLPKLLFVHHESYEEGVIGIVASRLVEKYHRPAIVVSRGSELSKASARSIRGVNIVETIRKAGAGFLLSVGGHPMAAGATVRTDDLELLSQKLNEISLKEISEDALVKNTRVDCEIDFSDITQELYGVLATFAPFGYGNPQPSFKTRKVMIEDARLVGKNSDHLKLRLRQSTTLSAIGFRMGELYPKLSQEEPIDIVYSIEQDFWNGNRKLQLKLREIVI